MTLSVGFGFYRKIPQFAIHDDSKRHPQTSDVIVIAVLGGTHQPGVRRRPESGSRRSGCTCRGEFGSSPSESSGGVGRLRDDFLGSRGVRRGRCCSAGNSGPGRRIGCVPSVTVVSLPLTLVTSVVVLPIMAAVNEYIQTDTAVCRISSINRLSLYPDSTVGRAFEWWTRNPFIGERESALGGV